MNKEKQEAACRKMRERWQKDRPPRPRARVATEEQAEMSVNLLEINITELIENLHDKDFRGEIGFGRPCVGFRSGESYVDFNPYKRSEYRKGLKMNTENKQRPVDDAEALGIKMIARLVQLVGITRTLDILSRARQAATMAAMPVEEYLKLSIAKAEQRDAPIN